MKTSDPSPVPADAVSFICQSCGHKFKSSPARVVDAPSRPWHPFEYFHPCSNCSGEASQAFWEVNIWKANAHATGPTTLQGIAAVTKNIAGHPTPEEAKRTRFNAVTHGAYAEVATFYPAKPGRYESCVGCDYLDNGCGDQPACLKRTELMLKHQVAFETGDPRMLTGIRSSLHARIQMIIDDITLAIARRGVEIETPQWYYDKDGLFHLAKYRQKNADGSDGDEILLTEVRQNPLLKTLGEYIGKIGLTLGDMGMTPKVQDDQNILKGHLDHETQEKETVLEYQKKQTLLMEQLSGQIARSRQSVAEDAVYKEYKEANQDE